MKKIICVVIISLIMSFTLTINSQASEKEYSYEEIDFLYNINFVLDDYVDKGSYIELYFTLTSDIFSENPYLQNTTQITENTIFYMYNFQTSKTNAFSTVIYSGIVEGYNLSGKINIGKTYFKYYYEEILQISELLFFSRLEQDYISDLCNYFKLYVKVDNQYQIGYDDGYNQGWEDGEYYGYFNGHDDGYYVGYDDGYNYGYSVGKNEGLNEGTSAWGVLFSSMLSTFGAILSIEIFPDLTIGMIAAVPLILGLLSFIIGVAKGGKKND